MKRWLVAFVVTTLLIPGVSVFAAGEQEADDAVELVYWSMWNETEPQAMVIKDAIDDFEEQNPGVRVTVQWNGREIRRILQPALDAGTRIDIWDEDLERIVKTWQGYALNLDSYYERSYATTGELTFAETTMGSLQELLRSFSTDGALYAVPYQPMVLVVFYNKDHFDAAGVRAVPRTWEEFLEVCRRLSDAGFTPITIDDAYIELPLGMHLNRTLGDWRAVEALVTDDTGELWRDPRVLEVARDFETLAQRGYISPQVADNKWPAGQQEVATGQVSMYFLNGTWLPNEVMATAGESFRWGQFPYPAVDPAIGDGAGTYGAQGFQINRESAHPDIAFQFLAHVTTGRWDQALSEATFGAPMDTAASWPVQIADSEAIFQELDTWIPWSGGLAADPDVLPVVKAEYTRLLAGRVTAEDFVAAIVAALR
ncbi:MAG: ABC transporter substrate-binding protein [Spirochaetales bacterium]|nr:ABC transporter substrate-binding protein [Spirochaetales bacterium]